MNEPKLYDSIKKSFIFLPTAGMRLSPEVLILELFRELFFERHYDLENAKLNTALKPGLNPALFDDIKEQLLIEIFKGRRKKGSKQNAGTYYAPAYPSLARKAWFAIKRERVVKNFFLEGPLAQYFSIRSNYDQYNESFKEAFVKALVGNNSYIKDIPEKADRKEKEMLSLLLNTDTDEFKYSESCKIAIKKIESYTDTNKHDETVSLIDNIEDPFASIIYNDLLSICRLEKNIPRIQWVYVLMTFIRFVMPMWMLSQMQLTTMLHDWLLEAIESNRLVSEENLIKSIKKRNQGLLHPTIIPTRELHEKIERYIRHRIELNFIIDLLDSVDPESNFKGRKITLKKEGTTCMSISNFVSKANILSQKIKGLQEIKDCGGVSNFLVRRGEEFPAWRSPLQKGQGKNIDEFLRVLYKDEMGDEMGGYLLIPKGRGITRGFLVFPGQLLLKVMAHLAYENKESKMLMLEDIERHFYNYGIDFYTAADTRPMLITELQNMGLLKGSPDAGSSVTVSAPFY